MIPPIAHARVATVRSLTVERQIVFLADGERRIVMIPDYQVQFSPILPWHRRGAIENETACGRPYTRHNVAFRAYKFDEDLCQDGCFSPHELRLGRAAKNGENR